NIKERREERMKKVLLAVSLLANVALAGALIYTTVEKNNLDRQRENLAIRNEQYQKKIEESSTINSTELRESTISTSNASMDNNYVERISESSTEPEEDSSGRVELLNHVYFFESFNGSITPREGELSHMSERFTRTPVTVKNNSGTWQADLYTNNDKTAQIVQEGTTLFDGTWKHTKAFEVLSLKSSLQNSTRNDLVSSFSQRSWNDPEVARLAQTVLENASNQSVSDEQWQQFSNDTIQKLDTMKKIN
ncbi:hypothetical protein, partial [Enterococcus thailandicus]|uniref:hypothetical protein n=2 Tax=Enterococcus TaxID=1350 RepID=UPI0022DFF791